MLPLNRRGLTLLELLLVVTVIAALGALALPCMHGSRKEENESGAVGALRTVEAAQRLHRERTGRFGDLRELSDAGLIDALLGGGGPRQGYRFVAAPSTTAPDRRWFATAAPIIPGTTGDRSFAANHEGTVFYAAGAGVGPIVIPADTCAVPSSASPMAR